MYYSEILDTGYPQIILGVLGLLSLNELRKFAKRNDIPAWMVKLHQDAARAATDENFRTSELEKVESALAKYPEPNPIPAINPTQERRLRTFPKLMMFTGLVGMVSVYTGLFQSMPKDGIRWPIFLGWGCLLVTFLLYLAVVGIQKRYSRVQLLNRKYLMQKAGKDPKKLDTLQKVIAYYPHLTGLKLEMADQLSQDGKSKQAIEVLKQAEKSGIDSIDIAIASASIQLRCKNFKECEKALDRAEKGRLLQDPRVELYRAALAICKKEQPKALEYIRQALEKDKKLCQVIVDRDGSLMEVKQSLAQVIGEQ